MRLRSTAVVVMGVVALVAGCGGGNASTDNDQPKASASAAGAESGGGEAGGGETGAGEAGPDEPVVEPSGASVPQLGDPVGERQIVYEGWTMTLAVFPLDRDSGGLVLNARLTYDKAGPEDAPGDMLSADGAFSQATGAPNGFVLVDKPGGTAYLPAVNENKTALCSPDLAFNDVAEGDQVYVSCLFGAPPESTTAVDVRASKFGVLPGVPVE